jgi:hypothetical protein
MKGGTVMPIDPRKRQKKLERRKAKQKAERRELARRQSGGMPARLSEAAAAPILHCVAASTVWDQGMGHVVVSRLLRNGNVAFASFLIDMYCLGVKDVFMNFIPRPLYEQRLYDKLSRQYKLVQLKPECARKLVEGAVQYALDLGFSPHADYRTARLIFGDIDATACSEQYEYGKDGKPLFFSGPHDSPARCKYIAQTLNERCGPDGHHFIIRIDPDEELLEGFHAIEHEAAAIKDDTEETS